MPTPVCTGTGKVSPPTLSPVVTPKISPRLSQSSETNTKISSDPPAQNSKNISECAKNSTDKGAGQFENVSCKADDVVEGKEQPKIQAEQPQEGVAKTNDGVNDLENDVKNLSLNQLSKEAANVANFVEEKRRSRSKTPSPRTSPKQVSPEASNHSSPGQSESPTRRSSQSACSGWTSLPM